MSVSMVKSLSTITEQKIAYNIMDTANVAKILPYWSWSMRDDDDDDNEWWWLWNKWEVKKKWLRFLTPWKHQNKWTGINKTNTYK